MNSNLTKVAIVTGGASGIGKCTSQKFADAGMAVVIGDLNRKDGEQFALDIREAGGQALFIETDVSQPEASEHLVKSAVSEFGRLDIAVNNAGIQGEQAKLADYPDDAWSQIMGINLSGVFYGMKHQIKAMLKNESGGAIVNVASILGQVAFSGSCGYVTTKHGVIGLTQTAALEYSRKGIRINSVGPGFISTPLISHIEEDDKIREMLISKHPIGRLGKPEEVAELIYWLCSDMASFVTGAYYPVDGGYLAQ
jgi:NAD(P)-dependent dehydrogenase (short-subunit alcohol dehydrogenase family)